MCILCPRPFPLPLPFLVRTCTHRAPHLRIGILPALRREVPAPGVPPSPCESVTMLPFLNSCLVLECPCRVCAPPLLAALAPSKRVHTYTYTPPSHAQTSRVDQAAGLIVELRSCFQLTDVRGDVGALVISTFQVNPHYLASPLVFPHVPRLRSSPFFCLADFSFDVHHLPLYPLVASQPPHPSSAPLVTSQPPNIVVLARFSSSHRVTTSVPIQQSALCYRADMVNAFLKILGKLSREATGTWLSLRGSCELRLVPTP